MVDGKRILQIIAIILTVTWMSMIAHKGYNDISIIISDNPDNWGLPIVRYLLENWAGGKEGGTL